MRGRVLVKYWSNVGQVLVKSYSSISRYSKMSICTYIFAIGCESILILNHDSWFPSRRQIVVIRLEELSCRMITILSLMEANEFVSDVANC